jgi:hypothetical protein
MCEYHEKMVSSSTPSSPAPNVVIPEDVPTFGATRLARQLNLDDMLPSAPTSTPRTSYEEEYTEYTSQAPSDHRTNPVKFWEVTHYCLNQSVY